MSRARDIASSGVTSAVLSAKAPLASPDFTGTVDLTGTTLNLDNDQINGSVISGGTWGGGGTFEGTLTGTIAKSVPCERHHYTTLLNSWSPWGLSSNTGSENGIRVQRLGPLYIISINAYHSSFGTGENSSVLLTLDSNITNPTNSIECGPQTFSSSANLDYTAHLRLSSNGNITAFINNPTGTGMHISGNFIGLDTSDGS